MNISKQDMQNIVESAKNRIIERIASRQDVQTMTEVARDRVMSYMHELIQVHQQQTFNRDNASRSQMIRRIANLETRIHSMESDIKAVRQLVEKLATAEPQRLQMPQQVDQTAEQAYARYIFRSV